MATFMIEHYLAGSNASERAADVAHVSRARRRLAVDGVAHISSLIVTVDEMCLHLFEADRAATVSTACSRADVPYDRIVRVEVHAAVRSGEGDNPTSEHRR